MDQLLSLLERNARLTNSELATMLSITEEEVAAKIAECEEKGIVRGYNTVIDWDRTEKNYVSARIELKVTPQKGMGFEEIAEIISQFEEVETVRLMSGGCDIAVTVSGTTFKEVALFVAHKLSTIDAVQSTATSFVLRTYKQNGVYVAAEARDDREVTSL